MRRFLIILLTLSSLVCLHHDKESTYWPVSIPEDQEVSGPVLAQAFVAAHEAGFIDGLVIVRNGYLIGESYFNGFDKEKPHIIMSDSKSFLSALTGIALEEQFIDSIDEKILGFFPEYVTPDLDSQKASITIRHLLTMRMGIADESDSNYSVYWRLHSTSNWVQSTLQEPLLSSPGDKMRYNTFQTHLLSALLTKATGGDLMNFGRRRLFGPLGIDCDRWTRDPQGIRFGGNEMYFTPREMARFGQLYLNQGEWSGLRIVPASWVDLTLSPSTDWTHPNAWGKFENYNYAYLWWLGQIEGKDLFMAYGYGGQFIVVFPELNLIVVSTAEHNVDPETSTLQEWAIFDIIAQHILPSVTE